MVKRIIILFLVFGILFVGCGRNSTKQVVFDHSWDGKPIIVQQINDHDSYDQINEITDPTRVEKLIQYLKGAEWKENVEIDIRLPDYRFTWNSYEHSVWVNEGSGRLELSTDDRSNYGTLSSKSSKIVFEILTGREFRY